MPLHIFEPRYRQLTLDLIAEVRPGRRFGVVATRPGWSTEVLGIDDVHEVGCAALLREVKGLPDGRFDILAVGERRFRLLDIDSTGAAYLVASIEWLPDTEPSANATALMPAWAATVRAAHQRYREVATHRLGSAATPIDTPPEQLAHLVAADCLLTIDDRQRLLEERCPARRLRLIRHLLHWETGVLRALRAVPLPRSALIDTNSLN